MACLECRAGLTCQACGHSVQAGVIGTGLRNGETYHTGEVAVLRAALRALGRRANGTPAAGRWDAYDALRRHMEADGILDGA